MFVFNSEYYFQDFLFRGDDTAINVWEPVELAVNSGANGDYVTFVYNYRDIKVNFVIGIN